MTHTESVAHLTREAGDAWRVVPRGLLPAVVVSVMPEPARESSESTDPQPWATDALISQAPAARRVADDAHGRPGGRGDPHAAQRRRQAHAATTPTWCRPTSRARRWSG